MHDDLLRIELVTEDAEQVALAVAGELDPSTSPALVERLSMGALAGRRVVLDLSEVTFVDSSGLRVLIEASSRLGERLVLRNPSSVVTRLLDLTGITAEFTVERA